MKRKWLNVVGAIIFLLLTRKTVHGVVRNLVLFQNLYLQWRSLVQLVQNVHIEEKKIYNCQIKIILIFLWDL